MLHILYTSTFNIINSHENQSDTICNDINYLKYFYHLFPTHVEKFYLLFDRYVNPKIEQLKTSINELYSQNNSITSESANLVKTKQTIENSSTHITTIVNKLIEAIDESNRFDTSPTTVKRQIGDKLEEIKKLDKTNEITEALEQKVQDIGEEAKRNLEQVKQKIQQHEEEIKQKICQQVGQIKGVLRKLDNGSTGRIKALEDKIERLVSRKIRGGSEKYGELIILHTKMFSLRPQLENFLPSKSFLREELRHSITIENFVDPDITKFIEGIDQNRKYIKTTMDDLEKILGKLQKYRERITEVLNGLNYCNESNIERCESKIGKGVSKIGGLKVLAGLEKKYSSSLKNAKEAIEFVEGFKKIVKGWKQILPPWFSSHVGSMPDIKEDELQEIKTLLKVINGLVKNMPDIKYRELKQIEHEIAEMIDKAKTAQRHLRNAQKMLDYLKEFNQQMETITKLSINGTGLEQIDTTIQNVQKASTVIKQAKEEIEKAKKQLKDGLEEDRNRSMTGQQRNGENDNMMPDDSNFNGKENGFQKFEEYKEKLEEIKEFKSTLTGITSGMRQLTNGTNQGNQVSDVDGVLSWLGEIDGTLTQVSQKTNPAVTKMKESHDKYKEKFNGTSSVNGGEIKGNVEEINEIPNKIAELQSLVRFNKVIVNIAKSVNETLNMVITTIINISTILMIMYFKLP